MEDHVLEYLRYEAGRWGVGFSHLNNKRLAIRDRYDSLQHRVNPLSVMPRVDPLSVKKLKKDFCVNFSVV